MQINNQYTSHIPAIQQQLKKSGFVHLTSFAEHITIPENWKTQNNPLLQRCKTQVLPTPSELRVFLQKVCNTNDEQETTAYKIEWQSYIQQHSFTQQNNFCIIIPITKGWPEESGGLFTFVDESANKIEVPTTNFSCTIIDCSMYTTTYLSYANHYTKSKDVVYLVVRI